MSVSRRRSGPLETVFVEIPEIALQPYEAAFGVGCETTGFFLSDEDRRLWRVEGVRDVTQSDALLRQALALAAAASGVDVALHRTPTEADDWLARNQASFPPQRIGRRFLVRGAHETTLPDAGRLVLTLDAGLAFGSGEHGSTRGCMRALELVAWRRPRRILDLGTGSGILAMAAVKLLRRPALASDIDPWSIRTARANAAANGVNHRLRFALADGWRSPRLRVAGPYDLVFANILARPLCQMAKGLAANLAPGGVAILSGLLNRQVRLVLASHRRQGLVLRSMLQDGQWSTLIVARPLAPRVMRARPLPGQA